MLIGTIKSKKGGVVMTLQEIKDMLLSSDYNHYPTAEEAAQELWEDFCPMDTELLMLAVKELESTWTS